MYRIHFLIAAFFLLGNLFLWAQLPQRLPAGVNTEYEEREPTPTPDGRGLYFWRRESPNNTGGLYDPGDIWYSRKEGGRWTEAYRAGNPLNGRGHDFVWQVSPRGDTLWIMHTAPGVADHGMSYSVRNSSGRWIGPQRVHIHDFRYQGSVKDFFLTPERVLFLTQTDTTTGLGGADIYYCLPINDTAWSKPINLGRPINTPGNEDAPYLTPDGQTLYFNSDGHGGQGSHDLYVSRRDGYSYRRWTEPENLGPPLNTPGYDFDFFLSPDQQIAYWGSSSPATQSLDLYQMNLNSCEVDIFPLRDTTLCEGQTLALNGIYQAGQVSYQWLKDGQPIPGATERKLATATSGRYQLIRRRPGCTDTSAARRVTFIQPPQAAIATPTSVLCLEGALTLEAQAPGVTRYQWQYAGREIPGATRPTHLVQAPGTYTLRVTNGGCAAESAPLTVQRFDKPIITASTDARGIIPVLPQWLWSNRLPKVRGKEYLEALAISSRQKAYVLSGEVRGRQVEHQVTIFGKQGLVEGQFSLGRRDKDQVHYLAALPDGDLVMADPERLLTRYTSSGQKKWSLNQPADHLIGLVTDNLGYIYVAGYFDDPLTVGGQRLEVPSRGGLFLLRYTPDGKLSWARTYPVDQSKEHLHHMLQVDALGNAYLAGRLELIGNFGPDHIARAKLNKSSYFLTCISPTGETQWVKEFTTERGRTQGYHAMKVDADGEILLCLNGSFWRMAPGGRISWAGALEGSRGEPVVALRLTSARKDGYALGVTQRGRYFLTKLNRLDRQTVLWQGSFDGENARHGLALHTDAEGYVYVAGLSETNELPGVQLDLTSGARGFLIKYGAPDGSLRQEPVELCSTREIFLQTLDEPGLRYQWYRNGRPLRGAEQATLPVDAPGTYQVRVYTPECDRLSNPRQVTDCGDDPLEQPLLTVREGRPLPPSPPPPAPKSAPKPSDDPYSLAGYADNNLILLLDVSGSMRDRDRMPVLQEALIELVKRMRPEDQITIITYAGGVNTVIEGTSAAEQSKIISAIENLGSSGGTKGRRALRRAYRLARRHYIEQGNNRVIMATDGGFPIRRLYGTAERMQSRAISLSVFSFGRLGNMKEESLEDLARKGGGNHRNITPENVEEALLQEVKAVRRKN